jgi:hypothetical protein
VCDIDEWVECNDAYLEKTDATVIKTEGYHMVGWHTNLENVTRGSHHIYWDKCAVFNRKAIEEMNYGPGCHKCNPEGDVVYNRERIYLYHMKCFHPMYFIRRHKLSASRVSELNRSKGWSKHYYSDTKRAVAYYLKVLVTSKKIRN